MYKTASAKPSTFAPITLMGKADGYSISEDSGGMFCMA
jgi:hypothetical protein